MRRKRIRITPMFLLSAFLIVCSFGLSLGYSSFHSNMTLGNISAVVRLNRDIRIVGISANGAEGSAEATYVNYNKHGISVDAKLPNSNSALIYKLRLANFGNSTEGILNVTGLPSNLTYEFTDYTIGTKLCDASNNCGSGMEREVTIKIKYANSGFNSSKIDYSLNMNVEFSPFYKVSYNADGGSVSPASKDVMYNSKYGTLPTPTKTGYNFSNWTYNSSVINENTLMRTASDHTIKATWTAKSYSVTVTGSNATITSSPVSVNFGSTNKFKVKPAEGYYLNKISCTNGYTATGFTTGTSATGEQEVTINNNSKDAASTCTVETKEASFTCSWGSVSYIEKNDVVTVPLTCTSVGTISSSDITTSNFTSSNQDIGRITAVTKTSSTSNKVVYNVSLKGWSAGKFDMTLNANSITSSSGIGNKASTISNVPVVDFELNSSSVALNLSSTKTFQLATTNSSGGYGTLSYTGYNTNTISVSASGLITAKAVGTTTITVKEGTYNLQRTVSVSVTTNYVINYQLSNLTSSNTSTSIGAGSSYSTTLTPTNTLQYGRPSSISIYVNNVAYSNYTYNSVNGALTVNSVNGDLKIVATATVLNTENISFSNPVVLPPDGKNLDSVSITQAKQIRVFQFTPTVTKTYTFTSYDPNADNRTVDPYGYLFEIGSTKNGQLITKEFLDSRAEAYSSSGSRTDLSNYAVVSNDDSGNGYNFSMSYECKAGVTYYLAISAYSSTKVESYIDVRITS